MEVHRSAANDTVRQKYSVQFGHNEEKSTVKYKEINEYRKFTGPAEMQKAINSFLGILEGITIDRTVDPLEAQEIKNWYDLYRGLINHHPFSEIIPAVDSALSDQIITYEEAEDLKWLCQQVTSGSYYDLVTSAIQTLHGLIHGLLANNILSDTEILELQGWLDDHSILKGTYPFDEIFSIVSSATEDGIITDDERNTLKAFFSEFIDTRDSYNLNELELAALRERYSVQGVCAKNPDIIIPGSIFCFTGASSIASRNEIADIIASIGGIFKNSVTQKTRYLIVGNDGNPCWAYSCYGRKIEAAVSLRKHGNPIAIVNEKDFWAAVEALRNG